MKARAELTRRDVAKIFGARRLSSPGTWAHFDCDPPESRRLPPNWRSLLTRATWCADRVDPDPNRRALLFEGSRLFAGSTSIACSLPCALPDPGPAFPIYLPTSINWGAIPGTDGARIWNGCLQTDSGLRIVAYWTAGEERIEPFPWAKYFEASESAAADARIYTRIEIVDRHVECLIQAFEGAPTDVVEILCGKGEIFLREVRPSFGPWTSSVVSVETKSTKGENFVDPVFVEASAMSKALGATGARGKVTLALRHPGDLIHVIGHDGSACVVSPVEPVRRVDSIEDLRVPSPPAQRAARTRRTGLAKIIPAMGGAQQRKTTR